MSNDQQVITRRKLVQRLAVKLDEANLVNVSNNDVRRLIEHLSMVISFLREMEKYPAGVSHYNPVKAVQPGHPSDDLLDKYCALDTQVQLSAQEQHEAKDHLSQCSFCRARVEFFQTLLVAGQHIHPGNPNEPRTPSLDIGGVSSPTSLTPGMGISAGAFRDDQ